MADFAGITMTWNRRNKGGVVSSRILSLGEEDLSGREIDTFVSSFAEEGTFLMEGGW